MDIHSLMGRASTMMSGKRNDDSMSDRLNYRYTVAILVIFAIINMNRLYTDQIKCWVNIEKTSKQTYSRSTHSFCFCYSNRYQHFLHQITMNMFVQYVSFKIHTISIIRIKFPNTQMLKNTARFYIINGSHFFSFSKRFYSMFHVCHGTHLELKVVYKYPILSNHHLIINYQQPTKCIVKCV